MEKYTALIIGATGATGKVLVQQLLADNDCKRVKVFVRKALALQHEKLEAIVIDFDKMENWSDQIKGDVLFSALGTTLKQAGSKEAQYTIDFTYQYNFARLAAANGVGQYVLVSSQGASKNAFMFYPKMKGELEEAVKALPFKTIHIFQPGILDRGEDDGRFFEKLAVKIFNSLNKVGLLTAQKPLQVADLARAMIAAFTSKASGKILLYKPTEILKLKA